MHLDTKRAERDLKRGELYRILTYKGYLTARFICAEARPSWNTQDRFDFGEPVYVFLNLESGRQIKVERKNILIR